MINQRGYVSLIELMIVAAIIGILMAIIIPVYKNRNNHNVQRAQTVTGIHELQEAVTPQVGVLQEQCVGEYVYVWGPGVIIQKKGDDGLPVRC